jgi:hypothetical protein
VARTAAAVYGRLDRLPLTDTVCSDIALKTKGCSPKNGVPLCELGTCFPPRAPSSLCCSPQRDRFLFPRNVSLQKSPPSVPAFREALSGALKRTSLHKYHATAAISSHSQLAVHHSRYHRHLTNTSPIPKSISLTQKKGELWRLSPPFGVLQTKRHPGLSRGTIQLSFHCVTSLVFNDRRQNVRASSASSPWPGETDPFDVYEG